MTSASWAVHACLGLGLARATSAEGRSFWFNYGRVWKWWNRARTLDSVLTAAGSLLAAVSFAAPAAAGALRKGAA